MNRLLLILGAMGFWACSGDVPAGETLFTTLPADRTGVDFANMVRETPDWNIIKYLYYYNGAGVAVGDVNNDGLEDIYFSANQLPGRLYLNRGDFRFEDVTEKAGVAGDSGETVWKTGVSMADVNGDGWLDIYVCEVGFYKSVNGQNRLFINNQDGTFSEKAAAYGLDFKGFGQQAAFLDYDQDGDLDVYLLNHSVHSSETFTSSENRKIRDAVSGDRLYRNEAGRFVDVSEEAGIYGGSMGYGLGVVTADLNNDGWTDIYVTNDFHENDYLYYNNGDGTFREDIRGSVGHTSAFSMGCDVADIDNDGWLDVFSLDMKPEDEAVRKASAGADHYNKYQHKIGFGYHPQFPRNNLQRNMGRRDSGVWFAEIGELAGVAATDWSWSPLFADFDLDGDEDLFVTNGIWHRPNDLDYLKFASHDEIQREASDQELAAKMPSGVVSNYAFRNAGDYRFESVAEAWGLNLKGCSNGAAYADFDNDGDLDLVVNNLNAPATIYRNDLAPESRGKYLKIKLLQKNKNPFSVGARVTVEAGGKVFTEEVSPVRGWESSMGYILHFGLGEVEKIDRIQVVWGAGKSRTLTDVAPNQLLTIEDEPSAPPVWPAAAPTLFAPQTGAFSPGFVHSENRFVDFNVEGLMPKMLSREGPKMAVGDVNGDGREDFYVGGAKGQAGAVFVRNTSGGSAFSEALENRPLFESEKMFEDTDAAFLDADGDGDLDLYVVSGGGEYREGAEWLADRLYLNDGRGRFRKAADALPDLRHNGGCVVAADFDGDGKTDLFVGSRSLPGSYGVAPESVVLFNRGGRFEEVSNRVFGGFNKLGMVSDAAWLAPERRLVIAGEWMPLMVFDFSVFPPKRAVLPETNGWWNTLRAADFDGDGDTDFLAGNLGLNTDLQASPAEPIRLYIKDFDQNYQTDPIMSWYRGGREYVYHSKDDLVGQLTALRKVFVEYQLFAHSTFKDIFPPETMHDVVKKSVNLFASVYVENQGDGTFKVSPLPRMAQFAPIYAFEVGDFNGDGRPDALAAGNFTEFQPHIGRMDASAGWLLSGRETGGFEVVEPRKSGFRAFGECRDIRVFEGESGKKLVVVARNNASLLCFENGGEE